MPAKPRAAPAHLASAQPSALAPSPAHRARRRATPPTASGRSRRVATMRRRRPPRGSHALRPRPRTRLQLPQPVHSLTPARAAFPLLQSREPLALPLTAPTHPPAQFAVAPPPRPEITRPQLRLALLQVALALAPPSKLRLSLPEPRHRRPWRRRARPPWKSPLLSSPAPSSCPIAFATFSRIPCARQLALSWPEMAAGLVAEPRRRASQPACARAHAPAYTC